MRFSALGGPDMLQARMFVQAIRKGVSAHGPLYSMRKPRTALVTTLAILAVTACGKPDYPAVQPPSLQSTISADGKMVATLDRTDQASPRLTVFRLDNGVEMRELPAPPHTTRIRFGLQGYELLLTHLIGDRHVADLLKWDLADPARPPEHIYRTVGAGDPLEVEPGLFMLIDCEAKEDEPGLCPRRAGWRWRLLTREGVLESFVRPIGITRAGTPNVIRGKGFFWVDQSATRISPSFPPKELPLFLEVAFPRTGPGPDTSHLESLGDETRNFVCDYDARRCLRVFLANWGKKGPGPYVYDVDVVFDGTQCSIDGLKGYIERQSMTPDGRAAVLTVADGYAAPRRVVVVRFDEDRCAPVAVQTIFQQGE